MSARWLFSAAVVAVLSSQAEAGRVFMSALSGTNERPDPVDAAGAGSATAMLSGEAGRYVLSYTLDYTNLSSAPVGGHIHYSILLPGLDPLEQTGPIVHHLDAEFAVLGTDGTIDGEWRFDDAQLPLTDALVDSLFDGELYFNLHTPAHPAGEIRGQVRAGDGATAIPLPPALLPGLAGLGMAGWVARRRRAAAR